MNTNARKPAAPFYSLLVTVALVVAFVWSPTPDFLTLVFASGITVSVSLFGGFTISRWKKIPLHHLGTAVGMALVMGVILSVLSLMITFDRDHPAGADEEREEFLSEVDSRSKEVRLLGIDGCELGTFRAQRVDRAEGEFWLKIHEEDLERFLQVTGDHLGEPIDFIWQGERVARSSFGEVIPSGLLPLVVPGETLQTDDWDEARKHLLEPFEQK
jgi:hypothetical protein